jgi:hypothetical protein
VPAPCGAGTQQEFLAVRRRHRAAEEETLHLVAIVLLEEGALRLGLHALRDDAEMQAVAERDDRLGDDAVVGRAGRLDVAHERAVDLHRVDRQPPQVAEARVAGAEVVHRQPHAQRAQALQRDDHVLGVVHHHALGELELEAARHPGGGERLAHRAHQPADPELARREVHRDQHRRVPLAAPLEPWAQAVRSTHSPMGTMRPVSSASGMKRSGR